MTRRRVCVVALLAFVIAALVAAPPADAATSAFRGAGYVLTGPHEVSISFRMPTFTCASGDSTSGIQVGAFSSGSVTEWDAEALLRCDGGGVYSQLEIDLGHAAKAIIGGTLAYPNHVIRIELSNLGTSAAVVSIRDTAVRRAQLRWRLGAAAPAVAVGAVANHQPKFTNIPVRMTVNSGRAFTSVPHPRQNRIRHGVTLTKTGAPSVGGTHFRLYFRHH